jgi:hypothetical protein
MALYGEAGPDAPEAFDANPADSTLAIDASGLGDAGATDSGGSADAALDANDAGADSDGSADADSGAVDAECTEAGQACSYLGTRALCNASLACAPCKDDSLCASAYGSPAQCLLGRCASVECVAQADCNTQPQPYCSFHFCSDCAYDTQCTGSTPFCDFIWPDGGLGGGRCIAEAGAVACADASDNSPCPNNPGDVCCGGSCQPGNCCSAQGGLAFCQRAGGPSLSCSSNVCTTCAPSNGTDFYVDPTNGSDITGTGSLALGDGGASSGCAFKTITRALAMVPAQAAPGTRIIVLGPATFGADEMLPITLRANIVLTSQGGAATFKPNQNTFTTEFVIQLAGPGAGIQGGAGAPLTVAATGDALYPSPFYGVFADRGTDDTTFLENVTVHDFGNGGILVLGRLTIRQGVESSGAQNFGLDVAGHVTIAVSGGQTPSSFSMNSVFIDVGGAPRYLGRGIFVEPGGAIDIRGVPGGTPGVGTVVANGNAETGITFYRSSGGPPPLPSVIAGLVAYGNGYRLGLPAGPSAGVLIYAGSNVKLRSSVILGNIGEGVLLIPTAYPILDGGASNDDISHVDLGTTNALDGGGSDWGKNTLQASSPDAGANSAAGICLALDPGSGTLAAAGNTFAGPRDCSSASPGLISASRGRCSAGVDVGIAANVPDAAAYDASSTGYAGNDIDVSNCTK